MKTSIYLIATLLMPTTSHAYKYVLQSTEATTGQTWQKSGQTITKHATGGGGYLIMPRDTLMYGPELPLGDHVNAVTTYLYTNMQDLVIPSGNIHLVNLYLPTAVSGTGAGYRWDVQTKTEYERPSTMLWGNLQPMRLPEYQLACELPPTVLFSKKWEGFTATFTATVAFSSTYAATPLTLDVTCSGKYVFKSDLKVEPTDSTIRLSGVAGVPVHKKSSVKITADQGKVRLSLVNNYNDKITVSFAEDRIRDQTDVSFTSTSVQTVPFYVRTVDTTVGDRSYSVLIAAIYI